MYRTLTFLIAFFFGGHAFAQETFTGRAEVCGRPDAWVYVLTTHQNKGFEAGKKAFLTLMDGKDPPCGFFSGTFEIRSKVGTFFGLKDLRNVPHDYVILEVRDTDGNGIMFVIMESVKPTYGQDI